MDSGPPEMRSEDDDAATLPALMAELGQVQDGVCIKDRFGRYLMVNAEGAALVGNVPEGLVGRTDREIFGEEGEEFLRADLAAMEHGVTEIIEEEPVVVDGDVRTYLKTRTPLRDARGEIIGLVVMSTDISERKRLEEELKKRESQLAEAQAIARVGSWEWNIPNDKVFWSAEFYEMLGMDPDNVEPTYQGFIDVIHPDDRPAAEGALRRALEKGGAYAAAHRLIRGDGGERLMLCRGRVYRDRRGLPLRMVGASLDLTDFMGVAEALRVSHNRLLAAEELAGTGSFEYDPASDSAIWSAGMYRLFGIRRDEFDGTLEGALRHLHPDDREQQRRAIEGLLRAGEHLGAKFRVRRGGGSIAELGARMEVVRGPRGEPQRVFGVCWEVSEEAPD